MLTVNELKEYVAMLQNIIPEISHNNVVIDESQLTRFLDKLKTIDSYMVVGIIPKHKPKGNIDLLRVDDYTTLLVVRKIVRSEQTHEQFLDFFNESQAVAKKITDKIFLDVMNDNYCGFIKNIVPGSIDINPIWGLASCDGYQIDFKLDNTY